jgi:Uma2 family endonuclease
MTADEYLYDTGETNRRRELSYGILREPPAPFFLHQVVVLKVARLWSGHVEPRHLGAVAVSPVDVVLDRERDLIVQPDVLFVAADRLSIIRGQVWGAPDLVAEVLSPGTRVHDGGDKLQWYRQCGVGECWLVDAVPERVTIVDFTGAQPVERSTRGLEPLHSSVLPALHASAFDLFS